MRKFFHYFLFISQIEPHSGVWGFWRPEHKDVRAKFEQAYALRSSLRGFTAVGVRIRNSHYPQFEGAQGINRFLCSKTFGRKMIRRTVTRSQIIFKRYIFREFFVSLHSLYDDSKRPAICGAARTHHHQMLSSNFLWHLQQVCNYET